MPNLPYNNGYWKFNVKNVFNTVCLSSYALKQTPLKFIPSSTEYDTLYSNHYIMWDFGDGSTMQKAYSAEHYFFYPGQYRVTMNIVLSTGEAVLDSYNQIVTIRDFIPNTYSFAPSANNTVLIAGQYSDEIKLERFNSPQSYSAAGYNFFINLSGSNSVYYDKTKLASEPYAFLLPTHRFIKRELVGGMYSDTVLEKLSTNSELLYGKLLDTNVHGKSSLVVPASSTDPNAFFVGTSGICGFYLVDDTENTNITYAFATLDTTNFPDNYTEYYNYPLDSTLPIKNVNSTYIQISTVQYKRPEKISITSNGLDGEGFVLPTFNIALTKYKESPINFVAKLKYNSNYSPKPSVNKLKLLERGQDYRTNHIKLSLISANTNGIPLTALRPGEEDWDGNLSEYTTIDATLFKEKGYAFLKGSFIIPESLPITKMCAISATGSILDGDCNAQFEVSGKSTNFNIFTNKGVNRVAVINENADMTDILESYAFQPVISQSPDLWNPFISTIMGTLSSETNAIGKRLYERTSNFIQNNVNIDTCDLSNLFSYAAEYNVKLNDYATKNLLINYPADLSRLVNIFSIKKSLLWGRRLQYRTNFRNRYNLNSDTKNRTDAIQDYMDGKTGANNLGEELSNESTLYKKDNYVVAKELYSNTYKLVPINITSVTTNSFPLSTFNSTLTGWGWGLTFPPDTVFGENENYSTFYKLSEFYEIYKFNDVVPGKYIGNLINWDDDYQTTIDIKEGTSLSSTYTPYFLSSFNNTPLKDWGTSGGIVEQNLSYQISKGLELLSATS
tara:strand:- start:3283 stop:5643 length:2361 start_codon:yes stop_codon:yes gene_type:complete